MNTAAEIVDVVVRLGPMIAAAGIWWFGFAMIHSNKRRAEAEDNRHTEAMTALTELIRRTSPPRAGPAE